MLTDDVVLSAVEESSSGLPVVTSDILIEGKGYSIERSSSAPSEFRIGTVDSLGSLALENVTVSGGSALLGGAFYNEGVLTIRDSTLSFNHADFVGGAVVNRGSLYLTRTVLSTNNARTAGDSNLGGAVFNQDYMAVEDTTFIGNIAGGLLSLPMTGAGGAIYSSSGSTVVISTSTFTANNAVAVGDDVAGSAIASAGSLALTNTTVSGNGNLSSVPAAIECGTASLDHVTFSGNNNHALACGGTVTATATIFANTNGDHCSGNVTGLNSVADDTSCGLMPDTLTGLDATLADNGGPTKTHALLPGSSAIEAAGFCGIATDQRGAPRVGACDIGAYEYLGCPIATLSDDLVTSLETVEECAISVGPNLAVVAPDGHLSLMFGQRVAFGDGFEVEAGARLSVARDPALLLVLPEQVAEERARRSGDRK